MISRLRSVLVAFALIAPAALTLAAQAEPVSQSDVTRASKAKLEAARASAAYQATESQKAADSLKAHAAEATEQEVPPGHKVTIVKKGEIVRRGYWTPSAPVAGTTPYTVQNEVFIPSGEETEPKVIWENPPSAPVSENAHKLLKPYND